MVMSSSLSLGHAPARMPSQHQVKCHQIVAHVHTTSSVAALAKAAFRPAAMPCFVGDSGRHADFENFGTQDLAGVGNDFG